MLCAAINRLNGTEFTTEGTQKIVDEFKLMLDGDDLGRAFYNCLISGYHGLKLINFENFSGNINTYQVVTER